MEKKDLFDQITEVTHNAEDLLNKLHETQSAMVEIMEENAELKIENQHLR
ncbi:DNA replication initiation control protein YabA, partial [Pediococcus acidilactici]|nr:DNA replication initiation control protein YabA [Pediococcus acidilactici]